MLTLRCRHHVATPGGSELPIFHINETVLHNSAIELGYVHFSLATTHDLLCVSKSGSQGCIIGKIFILPTDESNLSRTDQSTRSYPEFPFWIFGNIKDVERINCCVFSGRLCLSISPGSGEYS